MLESDEPESKSIEAVFEEAKNVIQLLRGLCRAIDKHPDDWDFLLDSMENGEKLRNWWVEDKAFVKEAEAKYGPVRKET